MKSQRPQGLRHDLLQRRQQDRPYQLVRSWSTVRASRALHRLIHGRLLTDPKQEAFSPIRNAQRPAIGVYHGSFAMGRMVELARRLRGLGRPEASRASERMLDEHLAKQRLAVAELKKLALTPQGARCLAEMEAHAVGD